MNTSHAAQKIVVGIKACGWLAFGTLDFGSLQSWRYCAHDVRGHAVLQFEHILQPTIEVVRPKMCSGRSVDELAGDPHPVRRLAHAAFEHVAHSQLVSHLLQVDGSALVSEARIASDH